MHFVFSYRSLHLKWYVHHCLVSGSTYTRKLLKLLHSLMELFATFRYDSCIHLLRNLLKLCINSNCEYFISNLLSYQEYLSIVSALCLSFQLLNSH